MRCYQRKTGGAASAEKSVGGAAQGPTLAGTRVQASTCVVYPVASSVYTGPAGRLLREPVIRRSSLAALPTSGGNLGFLAKKAPILADMDTRLRISWQN